MISLIKSRTSILVSILYGCALLSGIVPQTLLSIVIVSVLILLMDTDDLYCAYPIMMFYYSVFGVIFGLSVFRIFSILFLGHYLIRHRFRIKVTSAFIPLLVYVIYCMLVFSSYSIRDSIFVIMNVLCIIAVTQTIQEDNEKFRTFFKLFVIAAFCSYFTGIVTHNVMNVNWVFSGTNVLMNRFMATFEDPNYMCFFYTIAVFSMVTLELFRKKVRVLMIMVLSLMMLTTLSITAILGNALLWFAYLVLAKKVNAKIVALVVVIGIASIAAYGYGLEHHDFPVLGTLAYRIQDKLMALKLGDLDTVTTMRSTLSQDHLRFFSQQSILKMLFGGNLVNTYVVDLPNYEDLGAHNEYVDLLLNVGILGFLLMIGYVVYRFFTLWRTYKVEKKNTYLCALMVKMIWIYFAYTLTIFLDFRFMLPFFI